MKRTVVVNVVGLTPELVSAERTPKLAALAKEGAMRPLETVTPAVTCSAQSSMVTGLPVSGHGIVGNGWFFRDLCEVWLWRQSNHLVHGEKIWDAAKKRDASFTCAKLFWWFNMYSTADFAVTPRPLYPADGRKIPDIYTEPEALRNELNEKLGQFPLFNFWGPKADITSSRWIAESARRVFDDKGPTLTLVYLPHLDYDLQRFGPNDPRVTTALREVDEVAGALIDHVRARDARVIVLSEYGITEVDGAIHVNRALREAKLLRVRDELGTEKLDAGASEAFAVADHQVAHVYVKNPARVAKVKKLLESIHGIERVLDDAGKRELGIDHARAGELVAIARPNKWFTYYYWLDDARAPDFARTVDIHRKPGYDPVELFVDPTLRVPQLKVGFRLAQKVLGFRYLMDVIPLDATLVKGSHGRLTDKPEQGPLIMSTEAKLLPERVRATDVKQVVLDHLFEEEKS